MPDTHQPDTDHKVTATFPDLADKTAIVTGTSRGIGCGIAEFLGRQEMNVVLTARSEEPGLAFRDELRAAGITCEWIAADVSTKDGARSVLDTALEHFGKLDLLVNNAAQLGSRGFLDLDEEWYEASFERNCRMIYEPSILAAKYLSEQDHPGSIIHISSVGGLRAHRGKSGYDASKGAIDALTRCMAVDLAPYGIRVNGVAPGATRRVRPSHRPPNKRRRGGGQFIEGIPLQRAGYPEEYGAAVAFLASDAAAYITGQTIYVDGGLTAQLTPVGIHI
jgi:NAD(P)-dependent dehydrogenase (short-subunit alcohol dehydrogenase family)